MNPVIHHHLAIGMRLARNVGRHISITDAQLAMSKGKRMKYRGDTGLSVAPVGLGHGKVQRKQHIWSGFNLFFQGVAVQINHSGHQGRTAQIQNRCFFRAVRFDG